MAVVHNGGGWPAVWYVLNQARASGGVASMVKALRSPNTCKTCALGMGGQRGGMVNELGHDLEFCKKSVQAMAADMQPALPHWFADGMKLDSLRQLSSRELEHAGRLVQPLLRAAGDDRYRPVSWPDAMDLLVDKLRATAPEESFFYFSGRSSNEAGFLLQLVARLYGTNNVHNCSYYCHQASGVGLGSVIGSGTATVTLADIERCDLLWLIGANPSSNHPRLMKSIVELRRRGGKVIVINPMRELGLQRFRVPSDPRSMLFGPEVCDLYLQPRIGGDIALLTALARIALERGDVKRSFLDDHVEGVQEYVEHVMTQSWHDLRFRSGLSRQEMERAADLYGASKGSIFCWAMGLTHHVHGVQNVQSVANLALLRGMVGRPGAGLLPLRGHSNVQGMGSMGVTPALKARFFDNLQDHLGVELPTTPGLDTMACMERAHADGIRTAFLLGGNLHGSNPHTEYATEAMSKINFTVTLSTTLNTGHAWGAGQEALILPVRARDEEDQPTTQESMFNFVRLSDGGPTRHDGPRGEVEIIAELAERLFNSRDNPPPVDWTAMRRHGHIRQAIAAVVPGYGAIGPIGQTRQEFQIDGRTFHQPRFATPSGRARMHPVSLPDNALSDESRLRLMTMRSEGQFNTGVYEEGDLYRGQERRDVILMNIDDITRLGLRLDQPVTVVSDTGRLEGILVRQAPITAGDAAMYFPEANVLASRRVDPRSRTPAFKDVVVTIQT